VRQTWLPAADWAARQAEETFCDLIGLRIFGESYLQAFAYLLSPRLAGLRSVIYPNFRRRVSDLVNATNLFGVKMSSFPPKFTPAQYTDLFEDLSEPPEYERNKRLLLSLADHASQRQFDKVAKLASETVINADVTMPSDDKINEIYKDFELIAPAQAAGCLANILNAGWRGFHDENLWSGIPQIKSRNAVLKELLLKSIEVFEYEEIIGLP
jgi:hypothetical protein